MNWKDFWFSPIRTLSNFSILDTCKNKVNEQNYLPYDRKIKIWVILAGKQIMRRSTATIIRPWCDGVSSNNQCRGEAWMKSGAVSRRYAHRHELHGFSAIVLLIIWLSLMCRFLITWLFVSFLMQLDTDYT